MKKIIQNFNLNREYLNIDIIVDKNDNMHVIEIEFGPAEVSILSPVCFDYDFVENYINLYNNQKVKKQTKNIKNCAAIYFLSKYNFKLSKEVYLIEKKHINTVRIENYNEEINFFYLLRYHSSKNIFNYLKKYNISIKCIKT